VITRAMNRVARSHEPSGESDRGLTRGVTGGGPPANARCQDARPAWQTFDWPFVAARSVPVLLAGIWFVGDRNKRGRFGYDAHGHVRC
jgi:hypothetical protein